MATREMAAGVDHDHQGRPDRQGARAETIGTFDGHADSEHQKESADELHDQFRNHVVAPFFSLLNKSIHCEIREKLPSPCNYIGDMALLKCFVCDLAIQALVGGNCDRCEAYLKEGSSGRGSSECQGLRTTEQSGRLLRYV